MKNFFCSRKRHLLVSRLCLILVCLPLLLSSCSRLDLALDWAPRLVAGTIQDDFNLNNAETALLRDRVRLELKNVWSCCVQNQLQEVSDRWQKGFQSEAEVTDFLVGIHEKTRGPLVDQLSGTISSWLEERREGQLQEFVQNAIKKAKQRREKVSVEDRTKEATQRWERVFEFMCTSLSNKETKQVEDHFAANSFPLLPWMDARNLALTQLVGKPAPEIRKGLLEVAQGKLPLTDENRKLADKSTKASFALAAKMYWNFDEKKKRDCQSTFEKRRTQLNEYFAKHSK